MAGQIKMLIDEIITERSKGNSTIAMTTRTKILIKGIDPDSYTASSVDDPAVIEKAQKIAQELGVSLKS